MTMTSDASILPSPPGFAPWTDRNGHRTQNGLSPGGWQGGASGAGAPRNGNAADPAQPRPPRFPNIKDLQDQAASLDVNENTSLDVLLETGKKAIEQAKYYANRDEPDKAYVQYLRASEITINLIPHHSAYRSTASQRQGWLKQFAELMTAVKIKQGTMDDIKKQIVEDNLISLVKPVGAGDAVTPNGHTGIQPRGRENDPGQQALRMPSPSDYQDAVPVRASLSRMSSGVTDSLAERFARLKTSSSVQGKDGMRSPVSAVGYGDEQPSRPSSQASLRSPLRRPQGPRSMGSTDSVPPALPPKTPLNATPALPRAPDPTYNPISTVSGQGPPNPPRTSTESVRPANPRYAQLASESFAGSSNRTSLDEHPYRSRTPNGVHLMSEPKSKSAELPHTTSISAQDLIEYLRKYNILLIDVRPRSEYDSGHIYAKSIICVEPVVLKENVSAEELEERLVVSPDHEQSLFERRNEFDMVVYYDQRTDSVGYLAGSPVGTCAPHLRALHDTLYEFNAYKPLKDGRPPALLVGGLDAWIDLVGQQSLATSSTAAVMKSIQAKQPVRRPGRPLGRVPTVVSANSSTEVRKRRLREFTPLNPEELSAWMERSKNEEVDANTYVEGEILTEEPEEEAAVPTADSEPSSATSFVHSYEDFLRRFPEPHAVQQSMVVPDVSQSMTAAPQYAASIPSAPSRPRPALPRPSYSGVSDGSKIQPALARQNSATKTALYTPNSFLTRFKLPRTGLTNFGVTCYMNSTVQCLSATILMSKFFIDSRYRYYVQKNWKGSQGVMPGLYANLIRSLWKGDVEVIMPTSFRNFCGRLNREWAIDRQQDAKEFFDFLVDCLHEDLNVNWERTPLRPLTFDEEVLRERMPMVKVSKIEWDRYCHREDSFISSLFAGQHASRLRCTTCQRTSTTYEAFYSISVEIPEHGQGDIYQCLQSYTKEEMLSGDEVWKCPYCKCERVATKQIIITRAPQILVVHFKRFSASKTQSARKIHTPIEFPLHGLNMDRFVIANGNPTQGADQSAAAGSTASATTGPFIYDAYAVLRHIGTSMGSGHYVSLVRDTQRQCWRKFDDERTMDLQPRDLRPKDRLQNEQAYIVFYERVPAK